MKVLGSLRDTISASPRIGWQAGVLLGLTAFCFVFVPYPWFTNITGARFGVGWPVPTGAFKVGYVSPESPSGVHPHLYPTVVVNLALWWAVYVGLRLAANRETLFVFLRACLRVICLVSAMPFVIATTWIISGLRN
jgi:hypothetical protein